MGPWKGMTIALLVSFSTPVVAAENNNPVQAALMITTIVPFVIVGATTQATSYIPELFKSSKGDALAFIGSNGDIRGAQFEQAARYYRAHYSPPHVSDEQLAVAIATTY